MPLKDPIARREYMRKRFQTDPAYKAAHIARVRKSNDLHVEENDRIIAEFRRGGCLLCLEKAACCLTAHHLEPSKKTFALGENSRRRYTPKRIAAELEKCVCLCMNCHAKVHAGVKKVPEGIMCRDGATAAH